MCILSTTAPMFYAFGSVRGSGPSRRTVHAALRDVERGLKACKRVQGSYDRVAMVSVGGVVKRVGSVISDDGRVRATAETVDILRAVSEDIANGGGQYFSRLKLDRWSGWVIAGGGLWRVRVSWPDGAEMHEVDAQIEHVCDVL